MTIPIGSVLQPLRYPRSPWNLRGIPFHGFLGWGFGDPERLVESAELVVAVDVMTKRQILVYGEVAMFSVEFGGASQVFQVLAVELDLDTDEVDTLATLVEFVKGDHDLPWEVD
jgi:hypothetical protein